MSNVRSDEHEVTKEENERLRKHMYSKLKFPNWPNDVRAISMEGLVLLGVHTRSKKLYWDGDEIVTSVALGKREFVLALVAAVSAAALAIVELVRGAFQAICFIGSAFGWF